MEPIRQPHLGKEPSQQSYPTVLSQWHTLTLLSSELKQLLHPKVDYNSRPQMPKEFTNRHPETHTKLTGEELSLPE